jgi:hypothetical protein
MKFESFRLVATIESSFRGALLREPGIHNPAGNMDSGPAPQAGFRRLKTHPGMTRVMHL